MPRGKTDLDKKKWAVVGHDFVVKMMMTYDDALQLAKDKRRTDKTTFTVVTNTVARKMEKGRKK